MLQAPLAADLRPMTVLSRKSSPHHVAIAPRSTARQKSRHPHRQNQGRFDAAKEEGHPAAMAGVAEENVSRVMNDWMQRKVVSRSSGYYCVENIATLESQVKSYY
jgi:hypothetical protein